MKRCSQMGLHPNEKGYEKLGNFIDGLFIKNKTNKDKKKLNEFE